MSAGWKYDERGRVKIDFDPAFHLFYKYTTAQEQARWGIYDKRVTIGAPSFGVAKRLLSPRLLFPEEVFPAPWAQFGAPVCPPHPYWAQKGYVLFPEEVFLAPWAHFGTCVCLTHPYWAQKGYILFPEEYFSVPWAQFGTCVCLPAAPLQFYSLANKSFFFDGLQYLGEGFKEVAGAFDGVVEYDYGTGFKVRDYVAGAGVAVDVAVVVPAYDIPHYVVVSFIQDPCLIGTNAGIWGAEEV